MTYRGVVRNGVVVLRKGSNLPDGTEVDIAPLSEEEAPENGPTLAEQFADVIGIVTDLPPDMAKQHDHYLHGAPKR
jgi:hypothetical protein